MNSGKVHRILEQSKYHILKKTPCIFQLFHLLHSRIKLIDPILKLVCRKYLYNVTVTLNAALTLQKYSECNTPLKFML